MGFSTCIMIHFSGSILQSDGFPQKQSHRPNYLLDRRADHAVSMWDRMTSKPMAVMEAATCADTCKPSTFFHSCLDSEMAKSDSLSVNEKFCCSVLTLSWAVPGSQLSVYTG